MVDKKTNRLAIQKRHGDTAISDSRPYTQLNHVSLFAPGTLKYENTPYVINADQTVIKATAVGVAVYKMKHDGEDVIIVNRDCLFVPGGENRISQKQLRDLSNIDVETPASFRRHDKKTVMTVFHNDAPILNIPANPQDGAFYVQLESMSINEIEEIRVKLCRDYKLQVSNQASEVIKVFKEAVKKPEQSEAIEPKVTSQEQEVKAQEASRPKETRKGPEAIQLHIVKERRASRKPAANKPGATLVPRASQLPKAKEPAPIKSHTMESNQAKVKSEEISKSKEISMSEESEIKTEFTLQQINGQKAPKPEEKQSVSTPNTEEKQKRSVSNINGITITERVQNQKEIIHMSTENATVGRADNNYFENVNQVKVTCSGRPNKDPDKEKKQSKRTNRPLKYPDKEEPEPNNKQRRGNDQIMIKRTRYDRYEFTNQPSQAKQKIRYYTAKRLSMKLQSTTHHLQTLEESPISRLAS
jgi:hypothetical protein